MALERRWSPALLALAALHAHFKDVRDLLTSVLTALFPHPDPLSDRRGGGPWLRWIVRLAGDAVHPRLAADAVRGRAEPRSGSRWRRWRSSASAPAPVFSRLRETVVEAL
jgi:hypothetical protein